MKVHEFAKKLGVPTKELMATIHQLGIQANHHANTLSDADEKTLLAHLKKSTRTASVKTVSKETPKIRKVVKAKTAVAAPPPPPPPAEKKSFILIKKKVTPPPPLEEPVISPAPLMPATPSPVLVAAPVEEKKDLASPDTTLIPPSSTAEADTLSTPLPLVGKAVEQEASPEQEEKKAEKKKGKGPVKPEIKKGPIGKFGEKAKKPLTYWGLDSTAVTALTESRKWQDFKPIHKKQDHHKSAQKGAAAVLDVTKPRKKGVKIYEGITVKEFSELVGEKVSVIISKLMQLGKIATINQPISLDEAMLLAEEFGVPAEVVSEKTEEEILRPPSLPDDPTRLIQRPPVVTIMGHVDHGKTSLLDAIRQTKVVEGEAGGITQHIGAYTVTVHNKAVTFIDTPGHEAFTAMRARGAKVTDIVILVVAADDGVMPQTVEAINHAKAANVPIIVAINKIDKPEANPERVKTALTEYDLISEAWGGKTIFAEISAKKKLGLEHLLEMILLQAEVLELKGDPQKQMTGVIIEAKLDRGRGPVATVLVQEGTLKTGDAFVAGVQYGRVRTLINDMGEKVKEAGPAMPVEVIGFTGVPAAGDTLVVTLDERVAKAVAQDRMHLQRRIALAHTPRVTLTDFFSKVQKEAIKELRLVIKADVQGSAGALAESIEKLSTAAVKVRVIHKGVGGISESDVLLASASEAIVIGFNVRPDTSATAAAEQEKVDLRLYTIIYDAIEDVRQAMEGLLEPTYKENVVGRADVRQTFQLPKGGKICGCIVSSGTISRSGTKVRVIRDQAVAYEGKLGSLRRFKDDVKEVSAGLECGIGIENFNDVKVGDIIEVYTEEAVATKL